ncbi:MAG: hypothetical protein ACYDEQ_01975 [Desulfocucumaceae bacterium]
MSCYLRHMKGVMSRAGINPGSKEERKAVDLAIREIVGAGDIPCNQVWKMLKDRVMDPAGEEILAAELKRKYNG